ncbi:MAG: rhodanese-related sulfurtransferase, partial [Silvanigrellaceae bacterium]|nr:rhodanese-related sulfurtransferase [Silvanigrellaceae bacterium]
MNYQSKENAFVNISFYKFVKLHDLDKLKEQLLSKCLEWEIKGTILLAHEGINSCLVGKADNIEHICQFFESIYAFQGMDFKKSFSSEIPFRRMIIKIKTEIIPMGIPSIDPEKFTGAYVEPLELQRWLSDGEDIVILDTRNDYETALGKFRCAIDPKLKVFRDIPKWIDENFTITNKDKKIVTYCTGGIRCEKASAYLRQQGFQEVYQIKGGILKYFEETSKKQEQDNFFEGDCFVFDYRVAVDQKLEQANYDICYACWTPLTAEDKQSNLYAAKQHCPHCYEIACEKQKKKQILSQENNSASLAKRIERSKHMRLK